MFVLRQCTCCGGSGWEPPEGALLLNSILDQFGEEPFTVSELTAHAAAVGGPLAVILRPFSAKRLGRLLLSVEGLRVDDLMLSRLGDERNRVALWKISRLAV